MDWEVRQDPERLYKRFRFKDFREALAFANRVGELPPT
jgi:4a-hydroxytetrahydrobiopterin dehydratase